MKYDDIFDRPIREVPLDEIVARALKLRGDARLPSAANRAIAKKTGGKVKKAPPASKQLEMDDFFARTLAGLKKDSK